MAVVRGRVVRESLPERVAEAVFYVQRVCHLWSAVSTNSEILTVTLPTLRGGPRPRPPRSAPAERRPPAALGALRPAFPDPLTRDRLAPLASRSS